MKSGFRCGCSRSTIILAALAILVACAKVGPTSPNTRRATEVEVSGAEAWLVAPAAFKSVGVRTSCRLVRVADNPRRIDGDFRPGEGLALSDAEARRLYACAKPAMAAHYRRAGADLAVDYQDWVNYATTPYVSATHAERYANNYANDKAAAYGAYESLGELPVGAVVAKDSFSVDSDGRVTIGPLFLMEKVAHVEGAPYPSPWRFTMIMPDGWVFGTTDGPGAANVAFCADCHAAVADTQDSLYFLPPQYRR